jgi:putative ABC transport system permease protein
MLNKELGFNKEHLVVLEGANALGDRKEIFKYELLKDPQITHATYTDTYPGESYNNITGYSITGGNPDARYVLKTISTDYDYFDTYEMEILYGRKFLPGDRSAVILNESAVKLLGIENDPLSHHIISNGEPLPVIGVVKNFNHEALNISLDPMLIRIVDNRFLNDITIRITGRNIKEAMSFIHEKWNNISNNEPFEYYFLDEKLRSAYATEMKAGKVFSIFSILSVFIACMGILGIVTFLLQRRIKEIGIRKVNGARVLELLILLNRDIIKWVLIAFLVASPIAWYAMHKWLENFAFKTSLNWWIFVLAGLLALGIALLTVSWKIWKSATRNPVEALRYE